MTSVRKYVTHCFARLRTTLFRACAAGFLVLLAASAAHAQYTVTAAWDRNSDTLHHGYRLFYGTAAGSYQWSVDVGNQISAPLNLAAGRYYFVVRAYNASFQYGPASTEVTFTVGSTSSPTATITATRQSATTALVTWQTTNATSATINGTAVALSGSTTMSVSATTSTTFTLVARNAAGATATDTATVAPATTAPTATITATRQSATTALVTWQTTNATSATINGTAARPERLDDDDCQLHDVDDVHAGGEKCRRSDGDRHGHGAPATTAPTATITATRLTATTARVTWQTTNATSATINGTARSLDGSTTMSVSATTSTTFRLVARNAAGATATDTATVSAGTTAPLPPVNVRNSVAGTRVTVNWQRNPSGGAPTSYLLYIGRTMWGSEVINGRSLGNVLSATLTLPTGSYYVRLRARNALGNSASTQPVSFRIGTQLASPTGLTANWNGTQTTLTWVASSADSPETAPTDYVLEAGTAPGLADVAAVKVGEETSFSTDVPYGVYYVRVRATNDKGDSDPTPELVVAPPGTAEAPLELSSGGDGSTVTLSWTPPPGSEAPAGYVIEAGSDPGLSDIATIQVGNVTSFTTQAPPGTYFVRVRAINSRGPGLPSNEIIVEK